MSLQLELVESIKSLCKLALSAKEDVLRLILDGVSLGGEVNDSLLTVIRISKELQLSVPSLFVVIGDDTELISLEELASGSHDGEAWRLIIAKSEVAGLLPARENDHGIVFFSLNAFHEWIARWDPFLRPTATTPDLSKPTTIRVCGLKDSFGGPCLWVLPLDDAKPLVEDLTLPSSSEVHSLIHTNSTKALRVCPKSYSMTWGAIESAEALPLVRLSVNVMASSLVQELRYYGDEYEITLNGTKRLSLVLCNDIDEVEMSEDFITSLNKSVAWVYDEKPETRLGLLMDRLSIDVDSSKSFVYGLSLHLKAALLQAKDSYSFVILDRKDAYHKEIRELMKDMKAQADLYAQKVRDLVSSIARDTLGILIFITFSFVARFDKQNFSELLSSAGLSVISKVLASYLILSLVIQSAAHFRDVVLSDQESRKWLDMLQHYSSRDDKENRFLEPIRKRRNTFYTALGIAALIYFLLAIATWNLPSLISWLITMSSSDT